MSATIVVDLGFGDAGKGSIVDYLTRKAVRPVTIVRFNGGGQAAHNVITPHGTHHTFAQFGSGSFVPGTKTFLSRFMLVDPIAMFNEAEHLKQCGINPYRNLYVDAEAKIVTPFHKFANRTRETLRADARHGSCGMGIGECVEHSLKHPNRVLKVKHLADPIETELQLHAQLQWLLDQFEWADIQHHFGDVNFKDFITDITDRMCWVGRQFKLVDRDYLKSRVYIDNPDLIFEAAQGVLLDETYGFHPHTTWSSTTTKNALQLLNEIDYSERVHRLGVMRSYMTRHGAGPFPTQCDRLGARVSEPHNGTGKFQGSFRVGLLDLVLLKYALMVSPVDSIAVTCIDKLANPLKLYETITPVFGLCDHYYHTGQKIGSLTPLSEPSLTAQAGLTSFLFGCKPDYEIIPLSNGRWPKTDADFISRIESSLGLPVSIRSYGPTADDKEGLIQN